MKLSKGRFFFLKKMKPVFIMVAILMACYNRTVVAALPMPQGGITAIIDSAAIVQRKPIKLITLQMPKRETC